MIGNGLTIGSILIAGYLGNISQIFKRLLGTVNAAAHRLQRDDTLSQLVIVFRVSRRIRIDDNRGAIADIHLNIVVILRRCEQVANVGICRNLRFGVGAV